MHPHLSTGIRGVQIGSRVLQHHHNDAPAQLVAHVHDGLFALHGLNALARAEIRAEIADNSSIQPKYAMKHEKELTLDPI